MRPRSFPVLLTTNETARRRPEAAARSSAGSASAGEARLQPACVGNRKREAEDDRLSAHAVTGLALVSAGRGGRGDLDAVLAEDGAYAAAARDVPDRLAAAVVDGRRASWLARRRDGVDAALQEAVATCGLSRPSKFADTSFAKLIRGVTVTVVSLNGTTSPSRARK